MWTLKSLIDHCEHNTAGIDGECVPIRPINYQYSSLRKRLSDAWAVFTGKAEAFKWPKGQ